MSLITLDDWVLKAETRRTLDLLISGALQVPADGKTGLVLCGTNGTGKSSVARILPALLEPTISQQRTGMASQSNLHSSHWFSCEQNANGTKLTTQITERLRNGSWNDSKLHYIQLDEADNITPPAMKSLKNVMNSQWGAFILTTNNISAIERGVVSRCHVLDFDAAPEAAQMEWAEQWLAHEGLCVPANLPQIIKACGGDMRELRTDLRRAAATQKLAQQSALMNAQLKQQLTAVE